MTRGTRMALVDQLLQDLPLFWGQMDRNKMGLSKADRRSEGIMGMRPFMVFGGGILAAGTPASLLGMLKCAIWCLEKDNHVVTTRMGPWMHHECAARVIWRLAEFGTKTFTKVLYAVARERFEKLIESKAGKYLADDVRQSLLKSSRIFMARAGIGTSFRRIATNPSQENVSAEKSK